MTEVLIVGTEEAVLPGDLLAYETARTALAPYEIREPFANAVAVETISLGMAVSLLNDLDWYLSRVADAALVREPSVHEDEWLTRALAEGIRDGAIDPEETGDRVLLYRVEDGRLRLDTEATRPEGRQPWGEDTVVVRVTPA
ncbi:MAG: DUF5804 family protein [Halobacteriaceae archaeon]